MRVFRESVNTSLCKTSRGFILNALLVQAWGNTSARFNTNAGSGTHSVRSSSPVRDRPRLLLVCSGDLQQPQQQPEADEAPQLAAHPAAPDTGLAAGSSFPAGVTWIASWAANSSLNYQLLWPSPGSQTGSEAAARLKQKESANGNNVYAILQSANGNKVYAILNPSTVQMQSWYLIISPCIQSDICFPGLGHQAVSWARGSCSSAVTYE